MFMLGGGGGGGGCNRLPVANISCEIYTGTAEVYEGHNYWGGGGG